MWCKHAQSIWHINLGKRFSQIQYSTHLQNQGIWSLTTIHSFIYSFDSQLRNIELIIWLAVRGRKSLKFNHLLYFIDTLSLLNESGRLICWLFHKIRFYWCYHLLFQKNLIHQNTLLEYDYVLFEMRKNDDLD